MVREGGSRKEGIKGKYRYSKQREVEWNGSQSKGREASLRSAAGIKKRPRRCNFVPFQRRGKNGN
jgi:hypothetical protein